LEGTVRKGERTRAMIVARAAPLFNSRGYFGSSLADIMRATGLEKGGIYNHFDGKDDLAVQAFDYAAGLIRRRLRAAVDAHAHAADRLLAIVAVFRANVDDPPVAGGCPVLNTAVEADDAHPLLRERARAAMDGWSGLIRETIRGGIRAGEVRPGTDPDAVATVLIATLEGAIMLTKLYGDPVHMRRAVEHLTTYIDTTVRA
jgi:TetR/AcrR family transcriptional regulator, transcriptional repressor for nem operon